MLDTILIVFTLSVSFGAFVYLLSGLDRATSKKNARKAGVDREDPRLVFNKPWTLPVERPRICPLCGTYLERSDYLFAALGPEPPAGSARKRQAQIYGCPYCFGKEAVTRPRETALTRTAPL